MDIITQTLILGVTVAVVPLAIKVYEGWRDAKIIAARNEREDAVAMRAAAAVDAAQAAADEANRLNQTIGTKLIDIDEKSNVIHDLVNNNMTVQKKATLKALIVSLAALEETVETKEASKLRPTKHALDVIASTKAEIEALTGEIEERDRQARVIEANQAKQATE